MKTKFFAPLILAFVLIASGCSKTKKLANRLEGTWNIDMYSGVYTPSGSGTGTAYSYQNVGSFTFKDDNTGSYTMTFLGFTENGTFNWANTESTVTITQSGQTPSIYTVSTNEKTKQVWTYSETDADGTDNGTMTMTKK